MMDDLHVLHLNVNGLRGKSTEVGVYLAEMGPDVVCFNETKLTGQKPPFIAGYRPAAVRDRTIGRLQGGGVAIYVRNGLLYTDISPDMDDIVAIELTVGKIKYAVLAYYCPPYADVPLETATLERFARRYGRLIIAGDLNAKHQFYGCSRTDERGDVLFDFVERNNLWVCNDPSQPTRHDFTTGVGQVLDYFIISNPVIREFAECFVGDDASSDHWPVHLKLKLGGRLRAEETRQIRTLSKCNWATFSNEALQARTTLPTRQLDSEADIDDRCNDIRRIIVSALDTACPLRTVKQSVFRVSAATLRLIKLKRKLRRKMQRNPDIYRTVYHQVSRQVADAVKAERQQAWERATGRLNRDSGRQFWQTFKRLTGASKAGNCRYPKLVLSDGTTTSDPDAVSEEFAAALQQVHRVHEGPDFDDAERDRVEEYVSNNAASFTPTFQTPAPDDRPEGWMDDAVTTEEVASALSGCKNRSAPGPDSITYEVLKRVPEPLVSDLATLFTACIDRGYFPKPWKEAHGVMLPKPNKEGTVAANYRPISLLNTIGKLFERVLSRRLQEHLKDTAFFNDWQRAYQTRKEAAEIAYRLGEEARIAKENGWCTTLVSLDVEKAFDSVWHDALRYKLSQLGLPTRMLRVLSSFLSDRTISVRVGKSLSTAVTLKAGTPQGSVLSPVLFLIYVNDIPLQTARNCRAGQFADDVNVWSSGPSVPRAYAHVQRALTLIEGWCRKWRIKLNVAKTQLITLGSRRHARRAKKLRLFGQELVEAKEATVLGVKFDRPGNFTSHCRGKASKAMQRVNLLRVVSGRGWGANARTVLKLYKQYVRPVMDYGSVVTANACNTALSYLQRVEHRAMRIALRKPRTTRIRELYDDTGLEVLTTRLRRQRDTAIQRFGDTAAIRQLEETRTVIAPAAEDEEDASTTQPPASRRPDHDTTTTRPRLDTRPDSNTTRPPDNPDAAAGKVSGAGSPDQDGGSAGPATTTDKSSVPHVPMM